MARSIVYWISFLLLCSQYAKDLRRFPQFGNTLVQVIRSDRLLVETQLDHFDPEAGIITAAHTLNIADSVGHTTQSLAPTQNTLSANGKLSSLFEKIPAGISYTITGRITIQADGEYEFNKIVYTSTTKAVEFLFEYYLTGGQVILSSGFTGLSSGDTLLRYGHIWTTDTSGVELTLANATHSAIRNGGVVKDYTFSDQIDYPGITTFKARAFMEFNDTVLYSSPHLVKLTDYWVRINDFPGNYLWGTVSFVIGNKAFTGTGEILPTSITAKNKGVPTLNFWMFDPQSNAWTAVAPFPGKARYNATAFVVDGKAYVGTGRDHTQTFQDFYVYTPPPADRWDTIADYPIKIMGAAAFAINGRGYVCTGAVCANDFLSYGLPNCNAFEASTYEYRPDSNKWYQMADFPSGVSPRVFAVAFSIGSKGYVGTGLTPNYFSPGFYEFDPAAGATGKWTRRADFGAPGDGPPRLGAVGFSIGNYGYIGTGSTYNFPTYSDLWRYDPASDQWKSKASVGNLNREFATAFVLGNRAYVGLGFALTDNNRASREFWQYILEN